MLKPISKEAKRYLDYQRTVSPIAEEIDTYITQSQKYMQLQSESIGLLEQIIVELKKQIEILHFWKKESLR